MVERLRFHFDPACPWCYQTSRWARRLEELGWVELTWGLFSLELINQGDEESVRKGHAYAAPSLRIAQVLGEEVGSAAVGAFYATLGRRVHERAEPAAERPTLVGALEEAGLDASYLDKALADDSSWDRVREQHDRLVETTRSFGVPAIVLDDGQGPAIFGPVISEVPSDEDAVELLRHVVWLARYENFSELKRDRTVRPDLESVRQRQRQQAS